MEYSFEQPSRRSFHQTDRATAVERYASQLRRESVMDATCHVRTNLRLFDNVCTWPGGAWWDGRRLYFFFNFVLVIPEQLLFLEVHR